MSYSGPKKVKIMGNTIPINKKKLKSSGDYAQFSPWGFYIDISKDPMGPDVERRTIIHELIHTIEFTNINIKHLNEQQVEQLALGVYSLIRDNKEFIKWVQKK